MKTDIERFIDKLQLLDSGCWEWTACKDKDGYGVFSIRINSGRGFKNVKAHRFSYEYFVGTIPDGLEIDHLCRNRSCVNPSHMESVTNAENNRRGISPSAQNKRKTHCVHGHEFSEENTIFYKRGRACKACRSDVKKKYRSGAYGKEKEREYRERYRLEHREEIRVQRAKHRKELKEARLGQNNGYW